MKNILVVDLRDQIAISAMNAIIATGTTFNINATATEAYDYADAMLRARSKASEEDDDV